VKVLQFDIEDSSFQPVRELFPEAVEFLVKQRLENEVILVHCHAGISRSSTFLSAYFMTVFNWSRDEAIKYIKTCRDIAKPNGGFMNELARFQKHDRDNLRSSLLKKYGEPLIEMIDNDLAVIKHMNEGFELQPTVYFGAGSSTVGIHSTQNVAFFLDVSKAIFEVDEDDVSLWHLPSREVEPEMLNDGSVLLADLTLNPQSQFALMKGEEPPDPHVIFGLPKPDELPWEGGAYDDDL